MNDTTVPEGSNKYASFRPGVYLHYKGQLYEATHLAHDANHDGRVVVHYIALQLDGAHDGPRHAVRSWDDWNAYVHQNGSICEGIEERKCSDRQLIAPRFTYLGPV
jgi:hypothetical protein